MRSRLVDAFRDVRRKRSRLGGSQPADRGRRAAFFQVPDIHRRTATRVIHAVRTQTTQTPDNGIAIGVRNVQSLYGKREILDQAARQRLARHR